MTWRKGSGQPVVPHDDLVEEALCVGWVDSRPRRVDEQRTALPMTPRTAGSGWSRPNRERVARLQAAAALDAVPAARASWDGFPRSAKRGILEWVVQAKADATRDKRVRETVEHAAGGERANQWRPKT